MGLFDFFKSKGGGGGQDATEKTLMRHAERVLDKRAMSPDRFASIEWLCRLGSEEAWRALLPRYDFTVDPSITDREEKQYIFEHIIEAETAVEPLREYLRKTQVVNWPIKMLRKLLTTEEFVSELLDILKGEDTSYQKNPDRKIQSIIALEGEKDGRICAGVLPFLDDVNEDTRFHAVRTLFAQADAGAADGLFALLERDESMRIRTTVVDGLVESRWAGKIADRDKLTSLLNRLPNGPFSLGADGVITRLGRR